jgi:hypothetical protein
MEMRCIEDSLSEECAVIARFLMAATEATHRRGRSIQAAVTPKARRG